MRIARWLEGIGIEVEPADLPPGEFLPGLMLDRGRLLVDESRLEHPGDLLHEAGHVAVAPGWARPQLTGAIDVTGLDTAELEWAAIPWSYAAAVAAEVPPEEVFHADGYVGMSRGLLGTFLVGVPFAVTKLEERGMTATGPRAEALGVPPYPHMIRWLAE